MVLIDVIPLAAGAPSGTLSYRSKEDVPVGTLVSVPLRKKVVPAIVLSSTPVRDAKAQIKSAGFMLRATDLVVKGSVPAAYIEAAKDIAAYHATSPASVLGTMLVPVLHAVPSSFAAGKGFSEDSIEAPYVKRVDAYRKAAKQGPTLIIAPTLAELERLAASLADLKPVVLSGTLTKKKRDTALADAVDASLVLATPALAWAPVNDLATIIIERLSAGSYQLLKRPYLDVRIALKELAKRRGVKLMYGDYPLPLEFHAKTVKQKQTGTIIHDMRPDPDADRTAFKAVPDELRIALGKAVANGGRAVVLAVRKGYAPAVVCRDCGNMVVDERGQALSLVSVKDKPILRSADGKIIKDADAVCAHCGSWNLMGLGIGVERVAEELKEALPDAQVIRFDADEVKTPKAARAALARFAKHGSIAVGTEGMLPFLDPSEPVDLAVIASADSLLALPFWRARERLVRIGHQLQERSDALHIATRLPEDKAFDAIRSHDGAFEEEERLIRTALGYPPFGHLVVFHAEGTRSRLDEAAEQIRKALGTHSVTRLPDRLMLRGKMRLSMVAKFKDGAWPDAERSARLASMPPWIEVRIDAESLW